MSKVLNFIVLSAGILAMFALFGIGSSGGTTTSQILNSIGFSNNLSNVEGANLFKVVFGSPAGIIFAAGATGSIIAGFFSSSVAVTAITATLVASIATWIVGDLVIIYKIMQASVGGEFAFISNIILVGIVIYIVGAIIALISFWQGSDG